MVIPITHKKRVLKPNGQRREIRLEKLNAQKCKNKICTPYKDKAAFTFYK